MSCCVPDPSLGHLFELNRLGYLTMKIELIRDYGEFKAGDDISGLGDSQKRLLVNLKAAKITEVKDEKSSDNRKLSKKDK